MGLKETARALEDIGFGEIYLLRKPEYESSASSFLQKDRRRLLDVHFSSFKDCTRCDLHRSRTQVVFGDGNPFSSVVFVGEAPGEDEDRQGRPFVGRAGKYLNRKIEEVLGLKRDTVYITNVCKCRPPGNRKPTPLEIKACSPYLRKEIEIVRPKVICCLGATAGEGILGKRFSITKVRGSLYPYPYDPEIKVLLTYHPAYILRNPAADAEFVEDLKKLRGIIGQA